MDRQSYSEWFQNLLRFTVLMGYSINGIEQIDWRYYYDCGYSVGRAWREEFDEVG